MSYVAQGNLQDADIGSVTLALQTLGSFNFGGEFVLLKEDTTPPPPSLPPSLSQSSPPASTELC